MTATALFEEKKQLRSKLRRMSRTMNPGKRAGIDTCICRKTAELPVFQSASRVFCFLGVDWEIDTKDLIDRALEEGKEVCLPLVTGPGIMEARLITDRSELVPGAYDIPEPPPESVAVDPSTIDLAIVPCISCDRECMRLGQGGGFYDRFLEHADFYTIALCREDAVLDKVPAEPWDTPVNCVITECNIFKHKEEETHGTQV